MVDTGQVVSVRKPSVSREMGVRNCRISSLELAGTRLMVGRLAPDTSTSGRIEVNVLKMTLLLLGLGAMKKGRASAWPASSYWAAMEVTFREKGPSL
jgi:hypothetical protein